MTEPFDQAPPSWALGDQWRRDLHELLQRMDRDVEAIIVEGPNDRQALRDTGVTTSIHMCSRSNGLVGFATSVDADSIAILTDYDDHGRGLNGKLRELLPDAHVASRWRRELGLHLTQRGHYDIESINNVFGSRFHR